MSEKNKFSSQRLPNNNYKNVIISESQRKHFKTKLMKKYNVSDEDAEKIIDKINFKTTHNENYDNSPNTEFDQMEIDYSKQNQNNIPPTTSEQYLNQDPFNITKTKNSENENIDTKNKENNKFYEEDISDEYSLQKQQNQKIKQPEKINEILSNIIPDYTQEISIELNNVDLIFEVETDKIDTLKEGFIRTLKRNKSKKTKFQALTDITFKIYKGEKVGVIGYNGAGKSTLLNVITGIYPPHNGTVKTYCKISPLLSLGAGFDYNYSGRKNIYLNGAILGYDKEYLKSKEKEIIEFSELDEFIDFPIKNYSSGMLAKLGFSIATLVEPDILIIDEILGVGDVNFRRKSSDKIKSLMDGNTTVLLVSHSLPKIRELCDKAIWIDNGRLREIGDVNTVCDHYLKDSEKANKKQLENIRFK